MTLEEWQESSHPKTEEEVWNRALHLAAWYLSKKGKRLPDFVDLSNDQAIVDYCVSRIRMDRDYLIRFGDAKD